MNRREGQQGLTRREALAVSGAGALSAALWLAGCGDTGRESGGSDGATAPSASGQRTCVLTPEHTEGPYYVEDSRVRRDITEGRDGLPLELELAVQRVGSCEAIADATVEVWHCDALGAYSGFDAEGAPTDRETFLRGAQRSDRRGTARFRTVFPGWYQGRTPHIHIKVHAGGNEVHTGQLYFEDAVTAEVYRRAPYSTRGAPSTTNASDGIYGDGGEQSTLALIRSGEGYAGRLTLGVRT